MHSPTHRVCENLKVFGKDALKGSFYHYWVSVTTTYGLRRSSGGGRRPSTRRSAKPPTNLSNID